MLARAAVVDRRPQCVSSFVSFNVYVANGTVRTLWFDLPRVGGPFSIGLTWFTGSAMRFPPQKLPGNRPFLSYGYKTNHMWFWLCEDCAQHRLDVAVYRGARLKSSQNLVHRARTDNQSYWSLWSRATPSQMRVTCNTRFQWAPWKARACANAPEGHTYPAVTPQWGPGVMWEGRAPTIPEETA